MSVTNLTVEGDGNWLIGNEASDVTVANASGNQVLGNTLSTELILTSGAFRRGHMRWFCLDGALPRRCRSRAADATDDGRADVSDNLIEGNTAVGLYVGHRVHNNTVALNNVVVPSGNLSYLSFNWQPGVLSLSSGATPAPPAHLALP